jgi:endothelin-converting enzyme/putative endopeptidase
MTTPAEDTLMHRSNPLPAFALAVALSIFGSAVAAGNPALPYMPGLDVSAMDRSADPCEDFYRYSCGGWQKNNPIPADQSAWDVFGKLEHDNRVFLRGVLEQAAAAKGADAVTRQIGDYYASCMDDARVDQLGASPLTRDLARIAGARSPLGLVSVLVDLQRQAVGRGLLFDIGVAQDPDDSNAVIVELDQGGLGLPDRDYYFNDDAVSREQRAKYQAHIEKILALLGDAPRVARSSAAGIMRLETALAAASLTKVERRDPYKVRNKVSRAELAALAPRLNWPTYFSALRAPAFETVNVTAPAFFSAVSKRLQTEPLPLWKAYLRFHLANGRAPYLSAPFVTEDFEFYRKYLKGAKELEPRWKQCVKLVDQQLGEALGQVFVREVFSAQTKAAVLSMVNGIEAAMERRLRSRDWLSEPTRNAAVAKLHAIRNKIGYPDTWRDYSAVAVARGDFAGNVSRAAEQEFARNLAKIGKPVDRAEWSMTAPTVNAYYNAAMNDITFPAGVLQPPLYDPRMDAAPNYGNTGGTIGHELIHGFDDEGRQYDAQGNLRNWWTGQDADRFAARAQCVADQYGAYVAVDDIKVNSALTLGEDLADLGGAILAHEAWKDAVGSSTLPDIDGLTADQRFFVGFAQWACANVRPEQEREWALTDSHSPPRYRVNGVVVNMPEFAKAFACRPGTPMTKPAGSVCSVW